MAYKTIDTVEQVDVLVCGGGPVGLLTAYCLERYGISTYVVEQHDRAKQTMYGRAAMIAPRSLEMLDQLDLADALGQIGFVVRGQISYKNGKRVDSVSSPASGITDTFFDHLLLCRQRYTEDVIHQGYVGYSRRPVVFGARLASYHMDGKDSDYPISSTIELSNGQSTSLHSKYIIGADGGRSTVRELSGIAFEGGPNDRYWVRIDGIVKTSMPNARQGIVGIQSSSHGSVLWACLDHGRTRVGFALPPELWEEKGAKISQEEVIIEAQKALQPFTLDFETVDWWTVYSIGQRLAADYRKDRVFIAGDAAHTHSSGAAQGLNTGIHDAINLSWKLAGYVKGWYAAAVLDTYQSERRPVAEQIIQQDKTIATLIGGEIPDELRTDEEDDPNQLLTETYKKNQALNSGLGIHYSPNLLIAESTVLHGLKVSLGARAPDILVQRPGVHIPVRLFSAIKFLGKFTIITFCGDPSKTQSAIQQWQSHLQSHESYQSYPPELFQQIAIVVTPNDYGAATEKLGADGLGSVLYDVDAMAHERYGVGEDQGAILVLRPDGMVAVACCLTRGREVYDYFSAFLVARRADQANCKQKDEITGESDKGEVEVNGTGAS